MNKTLLITKSYFFKKNQLHLPNLAKFDGGWHRTSQSIQPYQKCLLAWCIQLITENNGGLFKIAFHVSVRFKKSVETGVSSFNSRSQPSKRKNCFSQLIKQLRTQTGFELMDKQLNGSELCSVYQTARSQSLVQNSKLASKYLDL